MDESNDLFGRICSRRRNGRTPPPSPRGRQCRLQPETTLATMDDYIAISMTYVNAFLRDQAIRGIDDLTFAIHSKAFRERRSAPALHFAGLEIDRFARELAFGFG